ncbi:MAG TPA: hypothetical protein VL625_00635 [Patescibacteria group bacterium]|nr:hypothetical protein [Patescibacteria group bacterium]
MAVAYEDFLSSVVEQSSILSNSGNADLAGVVMLRAGQLSSETFVTAAAIETAFGTSLRGMNTAPYDQQARTIITQAAKLAI